MPRERSAQRAVAALSERAALSVARSAQELVAE